MKSPRIAISWDTYLLAIRLRTERHYQRLAEIQKELNLSK